ncbi:MAG: anti-sigma factor [Candidatus Dormibacteraeota bacterium]|jgi:anti-sigma-K factor RskA|nr:anti-sigma factor [Candidatus Dormibacteraeota bacterium]
MSVDHEELENSIAAYVLGSADPEDEDRLRAHLEACASCRELAARLAPAVSSLPLEPEPVKPPRRLEDRVVAAAAATRGASDPKPRSIRRVWLPGPPRVRVRFSGLRAGLAAAAVLLFAAGAVAGSSLDRLGAQRPAARPPAAEVQRYQLAGSGPMAGVQANAVYLKRDSLTLVDFKYMPAPAPGQLYELWLITGDGRAVPAGVFSPESDGSKVVLVDRNLEGVKTVAVTAEPAPNGSQAPSQAPQLVGRIA